MRKKKDGGHQSFLIWFELLKRMLRVRLIRAKKLPQPTLLPENLSFKFSSCVFKAWEFWERDNDSSRQKCWERAFITAVEAKIKQNSFLKKKNSDSRLLDSLLLANY